MSGPRVTSAPLASARPRRGRPDFDARLTREGLAPLRRGPVTTLQVNVTRRCNLACHHCHVGSGPARTESMDRATAERVLEVLEASPSVEVLDLTGGAPEMCEHFRRLVEGARALGRRVIDRCNLTILSEPGQRGLAEFLARHEVEIVASLPCYSPENVERQRGRGVFGRSIEALRALAALGYGGEEAPLALDLVYNPPGPSLPPTQAELEARYRDELRERFGIGFRRLVTITNMPIERFAHDLARRGELEAYMGLLVNHFNPHTVPSLMCRSLVSVGFDGRLWDCDFDQMLALEPPGRVRTLWDLADLAALEGAPIATGPHCFGCTAGAGSSCGGALV